jgi:pimeloyl-ACP methyl ester carboxylesterase
MSLEGGSMSETKNQAIEVVDVGAVEVTFTDSGGGQTFLLLHGGAGPLSMSSFAERLFSERSVRVITPVHPGFQGTRRPETLHDVRGLAKLYVELLEYLGVSDVTVVGNSIGGWIAAEMALLNSRRVSAVVILDAVGIEVDGHPVADVSNKTLPEIQNLSYFEPEKFRIDPSTFSDEQRAVVAANLSSLALYAGGSSNTDPTLRDRLTGIRVPTLVVWGDSDGIADIEYGRAYASSIPGAQYIVMDRVGHLPQLEAPDRLISIVYEFASGQWS